MRRSRLLGFLLVLVALAAFGLSACGGSTSSSSTTTTPIVDPIEAATKHACKPGDFFMQCALRSQKPPSQRLNAQIFAYGIDFAWSCPSPSGHAFGASYLSNDGSKNWTRGCVNWYLSVGAKVVMVWETTSTRATQGYYAGRSDAQWAVSQAAYLGNTTRPIFFAIDCDCSGGSIAGYFDGVRSVLPRERTGAYGGYYPIAYLFDTGRIGYGWQSYAWSGGRWDSRAQLEQYFNDNSVDYDRAIAPDYGQYPFKVAPPPPPPDPYAYLPKTVFSLRHGVRASEYNTVKTWDRNRCRNPVIRPVCKSSHLHLQLLRDRAWFVAHHKRLNGRWVAVRNPRWSFTDTTPLGSRFAAMSHRLGLP